MKSTAKHDVVVDAWIERDEPILEPTSQQRQATFVVDTQSFTKRDAEYDKRKWKVRKEATINSIATGRQGNPHNIHVVGANVLSTKRLSYYSPAGSVGGPCSGPSAVEAADESEVLYGRLTYGNYDSVVVRRSGTSIAAAMHSRRLLAKVPQNASNSASRNPELGKESVPQPPPSKTLQSARKP